MSTEVAPADSLPKPARARLDLFLVSLLILFLELACIRWFPAHVLFLTFFTNVVLLGCFLGMSLGCLAASRPRNYLQYTPLLLAVALAAGAFVDRMHQRFAVDVNPRAQQLIFFGTEHHASDVEFFHIPMEVIMGVFFVLITLVMVGPGQELGRALTRLPNRIQAYTVNICGSLVGIVLFAGLSYLELGPLWWFLPVTAILGYLLLFPTGEPRKAQPLLVGLLLAQVLVLSASSTNHFLGDGPEGAEAYWSPYYRINYAKDERDITVNLIGHQRMFDTSQDTYFPHYSLPYLLNRDSQGPPIKNMLIIGAGSGNDLSRALMWNVEHIDAVEIDPRIQAIGKRDHPSHPYDQIENGRVTLHITDGRNFLRSTDKKYDLIVYALVDSLVLHSGYSNIRLESYLFTQEAFRDVKRCLNPGGRFVMYNYFRMGWLIGRLERGLTAVFGESPLVLLLSGNMTQPAVVQPEEGAGSFTVLIAGDNQSIRDAFQKHPIYWFKSGTPPGPQAQYRNGFDPPDQPSGWQQYRLATVVQPDQPLRMATDDWPFLYLREPMIPLRPSLTGALVMAALALLMLWFFLPRTEGTTVRPTFDPRMFFLGAGFMLVETKAVVHMALLFGSTWMVNSVVFFAVLVMILLANLFVLKFRPQQLWPYYVGLLASLALNALVPLDYFLGMERGTQVVGSCLLVFAPILFAGVIFALSFARTEHADAAFGANIAGAMVGGLAEYSSMLLGFQHLMFLAMVLYGLSLLGRSGERTEEKKVVEPVAAG